MSSSRAKQNRPNRRLTAVYRRGFEDGRRAALEAALSAAKPVAVAEIVSKHGDPEAFGERELVALVDIQNFPYRTKLYAALSTQVQDVAALDADEIAAAISTAACELGDVPDPEGDDTVSITVRDLEAIAHRHITVAIERAAAPAKLERGE